MGEIAAIARASARARPARDMIRGMGVGQPPQLCTACHGDNAEGKVVTTPDAKTPRPSLRKVVGEMVIISVKERTATAVITRNAQEIHTGDMVEIQ